MDKIQ